MGLVRRGYDAIAGRYAVARHHEPPPFLDDLAKQLGTGAEILDAGCGAGTSVGGGPIAFGFPVVGLDISTEQLLLAREARADLRLIQGDLRRLPFRPGTFDSVLCIYAVIHVPREWHSEVLAELRRVLRHPGFLLMSMGLEQWEGTEDFHGAEMYWSHFGLDGNRQLIQAAGFKIVRETIDAAAGERHAFFLAATGERLDNG